MKWLLGAETAGVAFVVMSAWSLPDPVASHFGDEGLANAFMSRGAYVTLMVVLVGALPLVVAGSFAFAHRWSAIGNNLPNQAYWLDPERQFATLSWLARSAQVFAAVLLVFLCYVHWLVVQANFAQPARMSQSLFIAGLATFFVLLCIWLAALVLRFRRTAW